MSCSPRWNYGDILDGLDAGFPADAPALIQGERTICWGELGRRSNNLARALLEAGLEPGDKVALYLRNEPAYVEGLAACFKMRGVHVNVNFRYLDDELHYILDNSDAAALIYGEQFRANVESLRPRLPGLKALIQAGGEKRPEGVLDYEETVTAGDGAALDIERSPEDLLFIYTGGTTGMPKGVMWRHEDVWGALGYGVNAVCNRGETPATPAMHIANAIRHGAGVRQVPCCPLMHGTGLLTAITTLTSGGCLVLLQQPSFDPVELFDAVDRNRVMGLVIVGDAFAKPMLKTLDQHPGRWQLSSLKAIVSSGVMWSREVKQGLLRHHSAMMLVDTFGSSEAVGFGSSVTTADGETRTARFQIGEHCKVFSEDHREIAPDSGEKGFIARSGPIPVGYYKDPKKSAETFPTIDGVRYSIPGDWCTVEADGTLTLFGRGSACINTAGEKVYPEEVEEALKTHPDVEDALVLGLPDEKWGQAVTGIVQLSGEAELDEAALRGHVRQQLAGYKTPKRILAVERMFRAPNGKADYKSATTFAADALAST